MLENTEIPAILPLLNHAPKESKHSDVTGGNFLVPFNVVEHMVNNTHKQLDIISPVIWTGKGKQELIRGFVQGHATHKHG